MRCPATTPRPLSSVQSACPSWGHPCQGKRVNCSTRPNSRPAREPTAAGKRRQQPSNLPPSRIYSAYNRPPTPATQNQLPTERRSWWSGQPGPVRRAGWIWRDAAELPEALQQQQLLAQAAAAAAAAGGLDKTARDDANRQDDKRQFMDEKRDTGTLQSRLTLPATPTVVSAGTLIPALFLTGISSDLPGQITAQVSQPVYDTPTGRHVIIPQGSVLIGAYDSRVTFGQNRVLLVWQRLRFPNGSSLDLEGMAGVDLSGYAGVSDKVNNHWGKVLSSVLLSSTVAAAVATAEGDSFSAFQRDAGQAASQGAAQQINQAGAQLLQRSINVQPTLEIRPGQRVAVMVNKDLALSPYGP